MEFDHIEEFYKVRKAVFEAIDFKFSSLGMDIRKIIQDEDELVNWAIIHKIKDIKKYKLNHVKKAKYSTYLTKILINALFTLYKKEVTLRRKRIMDIRAEEYMEFMDFTCESEYEEDSVEVYFQPDFLNMYFLSSRIDNRQRRIAHMYWNDNSDYRYIAKILEMSPSDVKRNLVSIEQKLKNFFSSPLELYMYFLNEKICFSEEELYQAYNQGYNINFIFSIEDEELLKVFQAKYIDGLQAIEIERQFNIGRCKLKKISDLIEERLGVILEKDLELTSKIMNQIAIENSNFQYGS